MVVLGTKRARYYIHGDFVDETRTTLYCARCDSVEPSAHIANCRPELVKRGRVTIDPHLDRYLRMRAAVMSVGWKVTNGKTFYRPDNAPNYFERPEAT